MPYKRDLITTIPFSSDPSLELEHEEMLIRCMRTKNHNLLIKLSGSEVEGELDFEITDPRPTKRLTRPN